MIQVQQVQVYWIYSLRIVGVSISVIAWEREKVYVVFCLLVTLFNEHLAFFVTGINGDVLVDDVSPKKWKIYSFEFKRSFIEQLVCNKHVLYFRGYSTCN